MTINVYGSKATRTQENKMFQEFLECLEDRWAASTDWIFVIANSLWNTAEIDLVCILPSAIFVADFKGHGGKLKGTENGPWQADGALVKGGQKVNPFQQLRDNKFSVLNWLASKELLPGRNLGHIAAGTVFSGRIDDQLELPVKIRSWFFPTDLDRCATFLGGLASPELRIERREAEEVVKRLGTEPIEWISNRPQVRDIKETPVHSQTRIKLTVQQREALETLCIFFASEELDTFSLLGMTSTGKSLLLAQAASEIEKSGKKPIVLAPNRRLTSCSRIEAESIYGHLYGGVSHDKQIREVTEDDKKLELIPLRKCEDEEDCIYLLDDAHLLGNSRYKTPDGKQYGTGHLLDDFLAFTEIRSSKRKAIFFGDHFQIQRSGDDTSALSGKFHKNKDLKHQFFELTQVVDNTGGSAKLKNEERLVSGIRSGRFTELDLQLDEDFRRVEKQDAIKELLEYYRSYPFNVWFLTETHAQANAFTQWLRKQLLSKESLESIEAGDLLEIFVDQQSKEFAIPSGSRVLSATLGTQSSHVQPLKGRPEPIIFHSVSCTLEGGGQEVSIFEEFLTSEKPELEADIAIAERVWRKSKDILSEPSFTYARYGYASTVHHAQGMSKDVCYINCDHAAGRHSEGFFRWLYSALTVAERKIVLLNFKDLHPFDSAIWNESAVNVASNIPVGAGWSFFPKDVVSEKNQLSKLPPGLEQSRDLEKSVAIWSRIAKATEPMGWRVVKAACHPYQELYDLVGSQGEESRLRIAYNSKNVITAMHVGDPVYWPFLADLAYLCLDTNGFSPEARNLLNILQSKHEGSDWKVVSASESAYRLLITVGRNMDELVSIEINFDIKTSIEGLPNKIKGSLL